ncbi:MAG: hypothetical protein KAT18_05830 [Candidatus Latescibacteria bacterium]|nr:hypothetical protein [Candidatus Latescibacterota bacterium]
MQKIPPKKVFYAVLNMGLGHATRSLPLIREFQRKQWQVVIGCSGRSLLFLKKEVPGARFVELPDYRLEHSEKGVELARFLGRVPGLLGTIARERRTVEEIVQDDEIDLVVSDHRYGCYSDVVPSFFLSHQLKLIAPPLLRPFEPVGIGFNRWFHGRYRHVIIPDIVNGNEGLLSGRLSRIRSGEGRYHFPGILSSISRREGVEEDIDLLVSISGPEPQRTVLEQIIRSQIGEVPGRRVVALGRPESEEIEYPESGLEIHHHLDRKQMEEYFNRSRLIVARSGYSTLMELAEVGKKALFVPTPGQTEQMYLARRFQRMEWFHAVSQQELDLARDTRIAVSYPGLPRRFSTAETIENIFPLLTGSAL